jgi:hypothetical protein
MTALTQDRKTAQLDPNSVIPQLLSFGVEAQTTIYGGAMVATDASGYAVPASANTALKVWGRAERQVINTTAAGAGSAGALQVSVRPGTYFFNVGTGADAITIADVGLPAYAIDDNTVGLTDGGGTRPFAGVIWSVPVAGQYLGQVAILVGPVSASASQEGGSTAYKARAVITSIQAYGGTGTGTLTESSNGALATQDGLSSLAVGDVVLLPEGTTNISAAADAGPYEIVSLGGASSEWQLTRPSWWEHGAAMQPDQGIDVGGEGTLFGGSTWRVHAAKGVVIDTGDPLLYPDKVTQQVTLSAGSIAITNVPILSATKSNFVLTLHATGGTTATTIMYEPTSVTAGALGTATVTAEAMSAPGTKQSSDTSVLNVTILN